MNKDIKIFMLLARYLELKGAHSQGWALFAGNQELNWDQKFCHILATTVAVYFSQVKWLT